MTPEELQEVVAAVIAALKTNGKTIDQLTAVTSLADTDNLEISNGKKVSFGKLKELVASSVVITEESIKGWVPIESTSDLPANPTPEEQEKAYILDTMLYVYVGSGGDTLSGKYQSVDLQGPQGATGPAGADGHDGVDLGEVALVNNLTEGGEESALTAEMGKRLKGMIDEFNGTIKASINNETLVLTTLDQTSAIINISGLSKSTVGAAPSGTDTATFTISGSRITMPITIAVSDSTHFSLSQSSISAPSDGVLADTTITITFTAPSDATVGDTFSCAITVTYNGQTAGTLNLSGVVAQRKSQGDTFNVGVLKYVVLTDTTKVSVEQIDLATTTGNVVVPSSVQDENGLYYSVTEVADNAFKASSANASLTGLQLPEGITKIGSSALYNRTGITSFVIPNSVTELGAACVYGCTQLASLTIGTGVTTIPNYFYGKCGDGRELVVPNNVTKIQNQYTFADTKFNLLDIGTGITSIDCRPTMNTGSVVIIRAAAIPTKTGYPFGKNASGQYSAPYLCAATLKVPSALVSTYQNTAGWGAADGNGNGMFTGSNQIISI